MCCKLLYYTIICSASIFLAFVTIPAYVRDFLFLDFLFPVTFMPSSVITIICSVMMCALLLVGSKDHIKVQGEILEGLVARIVSPESSKHMQEVLRDYPSPPTEGSMLI